MSKLAAFQTAWAPRVLSVLRIVAALMFIEHGTQKLFDFPPAAHPMPHPLPMMMFVGGIVEFVGGALLGLGLFTRCVAFIISGEMAVAYFTFHAPRDFYPINNMGDFAILFCFVFFYFFFAGPGPWSLDAVIARKKAGV